MNEQGSMLPSMAALIFVGLVVVGLALDVTLLAATYREAAFSADVGAEAGASQIAVDYDGQLRLDILRAELAAVESALAARSRPGRSASSTADLTLVCVTVTDRYQPKILSAVGVGPTTVSVEACAEPQRG